MEAMRAIAGNMADGALPKAEIPAGKLKTPAPTIDLTKLKISLGMVAVPPDATEESPTSPSLASDAAYRGEVEDCEGVLNLEG
mmetsp:Transcript_8563/g.18256  ORF Transcript_8563/g.18256 Transcript_8563/m.18256 type:complete len:83 (+) Transcript_8563:1255-1503(+)